MRLESVRVENFRQYYGVEEAEFSRADDRNVTVFHGMNGAGKTSLFSAISWCLYGAAVEGIGELVNKRVLSEAEEGTTITARVIVWFTHRNANGAARYTASRFLKVSKARQKAISLGTEFQLTKIRASGDYQKLDNPEGQMNAILPANVRPYFFFDGEKMEDLTRAGNEEVEEAVRNVMRIPALERAEAHLKDVAAGYRRQIKKQGSPEFERIISSEEELRGKKDRTHERMEELAEEIRLARRHVDELSKRLRGSELTRTHQENRERNQQRLKSYEEQERRLLRAIQAYANRSYAAHALKPMQKALKILDQKRERGEIPSGIREQFVEDLLHSLQCICGRDFHKGDEVHERLRGLLQKAASSKLESEVLGLAGNLRALPTRISEQVSLLDERMQERQNTVSSIEQTYRELDDIERQLRSVPEEEIAALERQRTKFERDRDAALQEEGRCKAETEYIDKQLADVVKRKREAEEKEKKLELLFKKEELAQKAADAVTKIKDEFSEQTRQEIEEATKEVFGQLAWKQDHFQDIRVDGNFRLEVIDRWGMPTRKELSAGERQILSLAFICAMARASGEDAPLIMDTPFGRLSGNHLAAVAENLPGLTSQLILFVTDREWDEASRTNLEPKAGIQYELDFDSKTGCTAIKEVAYR